MDVAMERVQLEHDGDALAAEVYSTGSATRPAVLVAHSALGIRDVERDVAKRLAGVGYTAIALDLFGNDFDGDPARAPEFYMALIGDPPRLRSRMVAWSDRCRELASVRPDRVAAIGYCFGGQCVLELARSGADVAATVSFHGLLSTHAPAKPGAIGGEVVAWCGADDPFAPAEQIDALRSEMSAAGARCQITTFGGVAHGFTDPDAASLGRAGIEYDALADRVSWAGTTALLDAVLRG